MISSEVLQAVWCENWMAGEFWENKWRIEDPRKSWVILLILINTKSRSAWAINSLQADSDSIIHIISNREPLSWHTIFFLQIYIYLNLMDQEEPQNQQEPVLEGHESPMPQTPKSVHQTQEDAASPLLQSEVSQRLPANDSPKPDHASNYSDDIEEEIPEEEWEQMKQDALARGDSTEPPKTRIVRRKIQKRKSTILLNLQPASSQSDFGALYIRNQLTDYLDSYDETKWVRDPNEILAVNFMNKHSSAQLFAWVTEQGIGMSEVEPPKLTADSFDPDFVYFFKLPHPKDVVIGIENVKEYVTDGVIQPNYLKSLLKSMNGQFIPQFVQDGSWPENVKKEFLAQLHKFMATLTEYSYTQEGITELYIPNEDLTNVEQASHDKDLLQRLEAILLHWQRQIKDIVNNQELAIENENAGPLDEIAYWRQRKNNLSHIHEQLEKPELKRIIQILSDSQYVQSFKDVTENIKLGSSQAEDNLENLKILYEPCKQLETAAPKEIPELLSNLLFRVRYIWEKSKYFNTPERIQGLLHKISNEIIKRCKSSINIDDMLDGDVEKCIKDLNDSIECGEQWKKIYQRMSLAIEKQSQIQKTAKWDFNNSIFAQVDAFISRCKELLEICEGQLQFARKGAGSHIPQFGGSRGQEIEDNLEEIKFSFGKHLMRIRGSDKDKILDVKASRWHDDFSSFRNGVKDLDVMYNNIITNAFDSMTTVQSGVELLEAFDQLAKRSTIKRVVQNKAVKVLELFISEMDATKHEFDNIKKGIPIPVNHGNHSGHAIWVFGLSQRIQRMRYWIDQMYFVDDNLKRNAIDKYEPLQQNLKQYIIDTRLKEWKEENKELEDIVLTSRLDRYVLYKADDKSPDLPLKNHLLRSRIGHLESNFDRQILKLTSETSAWQKLLAVGVVIPSYANDFTQNHKESLRVLRQLVMLVVRDYNNIIDYMTDMEKKLFIQHLEHVNKIILPLQSKLRWSAKTIIDGQVRECRKACQEMYLKLKMFKQNMEKIEGKCNEIANKLLIRIDPKKQYDHKSFEEEQEKWRRDMYQKLKVIFDEIRKILSDTYDPFLYDRLEVQKVWFRQVQAIDTRIEESFKQAVKNSLIALQKVVGTDDGKITPVPTFKLSVELENNVQEYRPSTNYLRQMIQQTCEYMKEIMKDFKRMDDVMLEERRKKLDEAISMKEKDPKQQQQQYRRQSEILSQTQGLFETEFAIKQQVEYQIRVKTDIEALETKIFSKLQKTCDALNSVDAHGTWNRFSWYWQQANLKEKFIKDMINRNDPITNIKSQLETFDIHQGEIQQIETTKTQDCIILDNTSIKSTLIDIMISWQNSFLKATEDKALQDLNQMYNIFQSSEANLEVVPQDLQQLKKSKDLWTKLNDDRPNLEGKLSPLEDKFKLLDDYNILLKDDDTLRRNNLRTAWANFNQMLDRIQQRNQKVYNNLYLDTQKNLEDFIKETSDYKVVFQGNAPYVATNMPNERAQMILSEYTDAVKAYRKKEESMKFGFDLFSISYVPSPDLDFMEKEINQLNFIWTTKDEWDTFIKTIGDTQFRSINCEELDEIGDDYLYKLKGLPKEVQKWEIVNHMKQVIDQFKQTLPLISMLRHECMRERHWDKLRQHLAAMIEPDSKEFNLAEIFKLNLLSYGDAVRENCEIAKEEFKIENALFKIEAKWKKQELEMDPFKKTYKLKRAEEIFTILEDHMAILSAQKTTAFYDSFKGQIESWENTLQQITETLEMLLVVQRQWIYLEAIFATQEKESEKQLMGDLNKFAAINTQLSSHMNRIAEDKNVKHALTYEGFYNELVINNQKLDESQKILYQLLEKQRKDFPRFYFLSNDDLFELLGNSKDVFKVNKHIKKCFEGIKKFDILTVTIPSGRGKIDVFEVNSMISPDNEVVKFVPKVPCDSQLEKWLTQAEKTMRDVLKKELLSTLQGIKKKEGMKWVDKWIKDHPGQLLITASQITWTLDCQNVLNQIFNSEKLEKAKAWKSVRDEKNSFIGELTKLIRKPGQETDRLKLVAMITIEVHQKEIIESLFKTCTSPFSFDWVKQLRFSGVAQGDIYDCKVEQTSSTFSYGYEYQGNNGRLVVTALTDRCYMTLTTAMILKKGGAPQGPAGTGKTETVKDLGKNMAKFVLVFNCSEGLDYKSIGRMFSGLVQVGGWGCFDEFNRIEVEVLSVVAQQVSQIMNALKEYEKNKDKSSFQLDSEIIPINDQFAIFITMNPGYAGRSELPDNLKSLFRPISMMVPENDIICHIMLTSEGFKNGHQLSTKMVTLYNLMIQQLSKQDHYDFGLRAIKSVLTCAGIIRREKASEGGRGEQQGKLDKEREKELEAEEAIQETLILMKAIKDMNLPKFVQEDVPLFNALFNDLFPNLDLPETINETLRDEIENQMRIMKLQQRPEHITKIIQLYDSKNTRHGNMLVGASLSGKSTCWKVLKQTLMALNEREPSKYPRVKIEVLNPKSVTINELFGFVNATMEWNDGVLSSMMGRLCKDESQDQKWMILDGPVDTLWIESMNTVLDDNKVLTLLNGDRISLPNNMGLIFEVENLAVASPATVSRAGMVYLDINDLGWRPYMESWVEKWADPILQETLFEMVERWIPKLFKQRKWCKELVSCSETNLIISLCNLLDSFMKTEKSLAPDTPNKSDVYWNLLEKWFTFGLVWSIGATVDEDGRRLIDQQMRDIDLIFPSQNSVYDYFVNSEKNEWASWEEKLGTGAWKPESNAPYHKMLVPTTDQVRNRNIITRLLTNKNAVLAVGTTGTGKTVLINGVLLQMFEFTTMNIVFSAQTSSLKTQEMIESKLVKRSKNKMIPDGKKMVIFIDDLNMPRKDQYGSQPPLELIRQWMDYEGWFDRVARELFKFILDIQFVAAMGPPGGGRAEISNRIQTKFNIINFTMLSDQQIKRIYQSILAFKFQEFEDEIKMLTEPITAATYNLFCLVQANFLPTPAKSHYVFNMRDISKVIQGVYQLDRLYCDNKMTVVRLWTHESLRVFQDRLVSFEDRKALQGLINDQLTASLQTTYKDCTNENEDETVFANFMEESGGKYIEINYSERENLRKFLEEKLNDFNTKWKSLSMNIVLFQEAVHYLCKINRIINLGKGHGMLVGEGGAGRHSLTKLATFIADFTIWQIEVSKNYRMKEFRDDIKKWCEDAGYKNKSGAFIFSDNQIVNEGFIEDINNILTVGEVPNLFSQKEDYPQIKDRIKKEFMRERQLEKDAKISEEDLIEFFFTRIQNNFHLMILMSKTGDNLRNYCRMYPGLVNNTTMIWFMPWPEQALVEVANRYLQQLKLEDDLTKSISIFFGNAHTKVLQLSQTMQRELKRLYYVTPTNYIELVKGYNDLMEKKKTELGSEIAKLSMGLEKLDDAAKNSEQLQQQLSIFSIELGKKSKDCEELMIKIESDSREAAEKQVEVETRSQQVEKEKTEVELLAEEAQKDLERAEPALRAAEQGLDQLDKQQLAEVKNYGKPPPAVDSVLQAIMIILGKDPTWASAKKEMASPEFLKWLKSVDKDHILNKTLIRLEKYTSDPDLTPAKVENISQAAGTLWRWVLSLEMYAKAFKDIEPKRAKVKYLRDKLKKSLEELAMLQENFQIIKNNIDTLKANLKKAKDDMEMYQRETIVLQNKLERAEKLISGLASTKEGWGIRRKELQGKLEVLVGDALMTAAFLSYAGPFPSEYREKFVAEQLIAQVRYLKIPFSKDWNFPDFLVKPVQFLEWNFKGLPDDQFSKENGVLVTHGRRWPLMIDPQVQANTWVKNMERAISKNNVKELDPSNEKMMQVIENAIIQGQVVILENVGEELDPSIEPVLNKSLRKFGEKYLMYMGEKEIVYNPNFRFYMTTKLANPKYKAEVQTRATLVNFTVKQKGLEEQLISVVIQIMEASLEKSKNELVQKKSQNETTLRKLDDDILKMLQEIKGSLIDDENLIHALDKSKETEEEVRKQIETSGVQMKKTFAARENYRSLARIASKIFFVLNDFSLIDHMYQFALSNYIEQFAENINAYQARGASINDSLQEKLQDIAARHSEETFKTACRGLFEKDKLLLAIQMAVKITSELKPQIQIDLEEYNFFLRGGDPNQDRKNQPHNPISDWISEHQWQQICDLDKLPNFNGLINAFTHNGKEWKKWYILATPEIDPLPGEWDQKCDTLRKMILLKIIRPDRVLLAAQGFVTATLGPYYTNPPAITYESIHADTSKHKPVIFILSPGVDPYHQLEAFSRSKQSTLIPVSLGQGQAQKAIDKLYEGSKAGYWLYLANCHLSLSFLKDLEKGMETLKQSDPHENFRLWLSSAPHPQFPISILQRCIKITTEPPKGVKANMFRLYSNMAQNKFDPKELKLNNPLYYMKLVYSLCWFHSLIIERKRFKSLGWNVIYDFNDSDWETADNILLMYVDQTQHDKHTQQQQQQLGGGGSDTPVQKSPPWDAIRYLIADVIYGGRVTDRFDQRLLKVYANSFFQDKIIFEEKYKLVDNSMYYYIPEEFKPKESKNDKISTHVGFYRAKIEDYPGVERAEVFGQHINAEISSQIADTNALIDSIISLSPQTMKAGEESIESRVQKLILELLNKVPEEIDVQEAIEKIRPGDQNPLKIVLMQEISRYNKLLFTVRSSLANLDKGLSGLVLISEDLESIMHSVSENKVPASWKFCYNSAKPLSSWVLDLERRILQLRNWIQKKQPDVFWISGFSFPTGFTTALLQQSARRLNIPIDQFGWEFQFLPHGSEPQAAKEGAYITGLFLEGAKWDEKNYIIDAENMKLFDIMPIILFRPVSLEGKQKPKKGQNFYTCPTYYYPQRNEYNGRKSYQFDVMLPCRPNPGGGANEEDFWIKRGTALLMSLGD